MKCECCLANSIDDLDRMEMTGGQSCPNDATWKVKPKKEFDEDDEAVYFWCDAHVKSGQDMIESKKHL